MSRGCEYVIHRLDQPIIPEKDRRRASEDRHDGRGSTPFGAAVGDIIVKECGVVQKLRGSGATDTVLVGLAVPAGAGHKQ